MKNNKWLLIALVVVIVGVAYWALKSDNLGEYTDQGTYASPTATPKSATNSKPKVNTASTGTPSYSDLVKEYANSRIQFDAMCQAVPSSLSIHNGLSIMLDNRSGDARTVVVDGKSYALQGYGYRVITLTSSSLPHEALISCGSAVNVGKIILQANIGGAAK